MSATHPPFVQDPDTDAGRYLTDTTQCLLEDAGIPEVERFRHERMTLIRRNGTPDAPLMRSLVATCGCGYSASASDVGVMFTKNPALQKLIRGHALEIIATFNPTVAEMTEWGWFAREEMS